MGRLSGSAVVLLYDGQGRGLQGGTGPLLASSGRAGAGAGAGAVQRMLTRLWSGGAGRSRCSLAIECRAGASGEAGDVKELAIRDGRGGLGEQVEVKGERGSEGVECARCRRSTHACPSHPCCDCGACVRCRGLPHLGSARPAHRYWEVLKPCSASRLEARARQRPSHWHTLFTLAIGYIYIELPIKRQSQSTSQTRPTAAQKNAATLKPCREPNLPSRRLFPVAADCFTTYAASPLTLASLFSPALPSCPPCRTHAAAAAAVPDCAAEYAGRLLTDLASSHASSSNAVMAFRVYAGGELRRMLWCFLDTRRLQLATKKATCTILFPSGQPVP